jgi:DNA adenine methylase
MGIFDNYVPEKIQPTHAYFGAKYYLARKIIRQFPEHRVYVECFAGALNVLINKYRAEVEVISDLDSELINFYQVLVDQTDELITEVQKIPYTLESFQAAQDSRKLPNQSNLARAVNYLLIRRSVWSGAGSNWVDEPKRRAGWSRLSEKLLPVAHRLRGVHILCRNALELLLEYDSPSTVFFLDPPYYPATRVSSKDYKIEMNSFDHLKLLNLIKKLKGHVVLSGYNNIYYQRALGNWQRIEIEVAAFSGQTALGQLKTRRVEVLWVKPSWRF